jgi:hypothetical protein
MSVGADILKCLFKLMTLKMLLLSVIRSLGWRKAQQNYQYESQLIIFMV